MIRVLVVEDSATVRQCLREALTPADGFQVVGEATDGGQAVELCRQLRPDVITMDVVLPVMSGLAATEQIMARHPTPILVVSSADRRELFTTYDALAAGAVDVLEKPRGDAGDEGWGRRLRTAVRVVSRIRVVTRRLAAVPPPAPPPAASPADARVVVIGASTGGPGAIVRLLRGLPAGLPVPVLYVQHLAANESFAQAFTGWLAEQTGHAVGYARGGEALSALGGRVTMAPPDLHLLLRNGHLHVSAGPARHSCRPSVDTLFESVAAEAGRSAVGCLLTGMGRDGAAGLLALRRAGALTLAQDEATCVVHGMPREAVALGAAAEVLTPEQMAQRLAALRAGAVR
ncbi:chemotaxis-specific protein-glutamate methyltransferase CheB [Dactylosporangium sp. AC04546]|uniref:chemotaxis-specific protein-glutamate methyltransferase CheB n=1 Tax=Dactylosporangium sp. AC04546 TaxID=2862460 RepID=UPI001EDFEF28|nr:chemotaxis-specific protein-glutamate methyltransferase CheB [Dactylosporangium sp. AC04546]WVK79983.1 chemotaxis-specific protein-glutamate methyltransferase CheB [Dactylosporangium sp. AC04546]